MKATSVVKSMLLSLAFAVCAAAQTQRPDSPEALKSEARFLRSQNQQLIKENAELKAELAALKRGGNAPTTNPVAATRPVALSNVADPKRVVFILDGSGSMLVAFPSAQTEVLKLIKELKPNQSFAVVLDQETTVSALPRALLVANDQNKERISQIVLKLHPRGSDNFAVSMKAAMAMNPDLVWWVGDVPQYWNRDLAELPKLNARKVRINTIPQNLNSIGNKDDRTRTLWFAWNLANDSGGMCFDDKGDAITEKPAEPPPPIAPGQPVRIEIQVQ